MRRPRPTAARAARRARPSSAAHGARLELEGAADAAESRAAETASAAIGGKRRAHGRSRLRLGTSLAKTSRSDLHDPALTPDGPGSTQEPSLMDPRNDHETNPQHAPRPRTAAREATTQRISFGRPGWEVPHADLLSNAAAWRQSQRNMECRRLRPRLIACCSPSQTMRRELFRAGLLQIHPSKPSK